MKIQVFKSEYTGELFESETQYKLHIEKCEKEKLAFEIEEKLLADEHNIKNSPRLTATSIEDFRLKVIDAINILTQNKTNKLVSLEFNNLRFGTVKNTHSAPIGEQTNFYKTVGIPTSYWGWSGEVLITIKEEKKHDDIEKLVQYFPAINTGSGGSRNNNSYGAKNSNYILGYTLNLYLQDFPILQKEHERYLELFENETMWKEEIVIFSNKVNDADTVLKNKKQAHGITLQELAKMEMKVIALNNEIAKIKSDNINSVLLSNPFKDLDELNILSNKFSSSYY